MSFPGVALVSDDTRSHANDSVVADPVAAAVLNISLRTLRRNDPVRSIKLSARRIGRRVGDIRALLQGGNVAA